MKRLSKSVFPVGVLIAAVWFLFNPNITLFDLLPDCVAYALLLYALRRVSVFVPYMREASNGFRKLFYVSVVKIPALVIMLTMASQRITILLFTTSFAILELCFLFPALINFFEGLFYLGQRFNYESAIKAEGKRANPEAVRLVTLIFASAKAALSFLPDTAFLFEYDPLTGKGVAVTSIQYAMLLAIAFLLSLIMGIVWLSYILPYLRALSKEAPLPFDDSVKQQENRRLRLSLPYFLFSLAAVFSVDLVIDDVMLLPDYLSAVCFVLLALLTFRLSKGIGGVALVGSGIYALFTILYAVYHKSFYSLYSISDVGRLPEASEAYVPLAVTALISDILFILLFVLFLLLLHRFYRKELPLDVPMNAYEERLLKEEKRHLSRRYTLLAVFSVLSSLFSVLNLLLSVLTVNVPMQPGYSGNALYLPVAGSLWLFALLFSLVLAVFTSLFAKERVYDLFLAHELSEGQED